MTIIVLNWPEDYSGVSEHFENSHLTILGLQNL